MFDMQRGAGPTRRTINTRHILFIVSGAFSGLEKVVRDRLRSGTIGFGAPSGSRSAVMDSELFRHVRTEDFINFGFEAEFIGRLPVRVVCEPLGEGDLFEIMKRSEGSLIRQYEREFEAFGIGASFDDDALRAIARMAAGEKTGARGLMTVCERLLRDFKFDLPGTSVRELVVDGALVADPAAAADRYRELARQVDPVQAAGEADQFAREFLDGTGIAIAFAPEAVAVLGERAAAAGTTVLKLCREQFKDYGFGLKLIIKNSGLGPDARFALSAEAVADPDRYLSDLVVRSYRPSDPAPPEGGQG
jgi:hypothetical protein